MDKFLSWFLVAAFQLFSFSLAKQPNIIFLFADDLGWNDVGFNNPLVDTPHIDQLATNGVLLNQSYALPTCSPSRHSFLTGRYPFRDGVQHLVFTDVHPKCVPLDLPMLPEKLKELGYATHLVGKWHLGHCNVKCTPTHRGFDSFYGFYGGENDHYRHFRGGAQDFRDNSEVVIDKTGQFSTPLFTERAVDLIGAHHGETPLFLYMAYDMTHYPLQAPESYEEKYSHVKDEARRKYLAMTAILDESVGKLVSALNQKNVMEDSLVVFMSDNGGQPKFAGNNYPLRGAKLTLWEGGVRVPTVVSGGVVKNTGAQNNGLFHISDWYSTLVSIAGGKTGQCGEPMVDGLDQSDMILNAGESVRRDMVYNIDMHVDKFPPIAGFGAYRFGDYKLMMGYPGAGDLGTPSPWVKPSEQCEVENNPDDIECQYTGAVTGESKEQIRDNQNSKRGDVEKRMKDTTLRLFNLKDDPTEKNDISAEFPEMTSLLKEKLVRYMEEVALPMMPRPIPDPAMRIQDGFHGPGWCTEEHLSSVREASLAGSKRREILADTCEKS